MIITTKLKGNLLLSLMDLTSRYQDGDGIENSFDPDDDNDGFSDQ